jgi:cytoskeletal protein CcmA (bactofilin family)
VAEPPAPAEPAAEAPAAQPAPEAEEAVLAAEAPAMEPAPMELWEDPDRVVEMEIDGAFTFPMELSVGATFLITEEGRVTADIAAVHAVIFGHYTGTLRATRSIRVGPAGVVEGQLEAPEIELAPGAVVNGLRAGGPPAPATPHDESTTDSSTEAEAGGEGDDEIFVESPIFVEGVSRR